MDKVPSWAEYFMEIAKTVSIRSKDPSTKVGAIVVDENKHIIGTGYNGMVPGVSDDAEKKLWPKPQKYDYVIHAEMNAILHSTRPVRGCTLYTTMFPCHQCAKLIASAGIKSICYYDGRYDNEISRTTFNLAGISLHKVEIR